MVRDGSVGFGWCGCGGWEVFVCFWICSGRRGEVVDVNLQADVLKATAVACGT
jgi:hypothetical protein